MFLNDGTGNFGQPQEIQRSETFSIHQPEKVAATDLDGDGDLDLIFIHGSVGTAGIYKGNGAGGFTPQPIVGIGFFTASAIG